MGHGLATDRRLKIMIVLRALVLSRVCFAFVTPLAAQFLPGVPVTEAGAAEQVAADMLGRDAPRGMVNGLLAALRDEDYGKAAQFLDLSGFNEDIRDTRGATLAESLKALLDRRGTILASYQLSSDPVGLVDDGLPTRYG